MFLLRNYLRLDLSELDPDGSMHTGRPISIILCVPSIRKLETVFLQFHDSHISAKKSSVRFNWLSD